MNIEVVTRRQDLVGLAQCWDDLARRDARDGFFRTLGWYTAWMEHIRPDAEPFVIVVRNEGGEIVGLAPLCRGVYRDLGFRLTGIFWAGREVVSGDFLDFLSTTEARSQVTAAILEFLARSCSRWSMLVLGELVDGSDSYTALERMENSLAWHSGARKNVSARISRYLPPSTNTWAAWVVPHAITSAGVCVMWKRRARV